MKIAQFTSTLLHPLGGAEQYCLALTRWLVQSGHECVVYTGWASDGVVAQLTSEGIRVVVLDESRPYAPNSKGSGLSKYWFHLLDLLHSTVPNRSLRSMLAEEFDVVHVHRFQGFGTGILAATKQAVVHTVHDYALVDTGATSMRNDAAPAVLPLVQRIRTFASNFSIRHTVALVFPSARTRDRHRLLGLSPRPGSDVVIPHGWQVRSGQNRQSDLVAKSPLIFLFMGKLTAAKGILLLLSAWDKGIAGAELWIAGAGDETELCKAAARSGTVRYLGWLEPDGRAEILGSSTVLVMPSLWPENFPLVVAEALNSGLPVIATESASPPLVVSEESGLLTGNMPHLLRGAMERLVNDPGLLSVLQAGAAKKSLELDFDLHGRRIVDLYVSLVARNDSSHSRARTNGS